MKTRNEVIRFLENNKDLLLSEFGVRKIGIFGSFAKDLHSKGSDLDILIKMDPTKKNIHNFLGLKRFLEKELGIEVDVGFEEALKPVIKDQVAKEVIYVW